MKTMISCISAIAIAVCLMSAVPPSESKAQQGSDINAVVGPVTPTASFNMEIMVEVRMEKITCEGERECERETGKVKAKARRKAAKQGPGACRELADRMRAKSSKYLYVSLDHVIPEGNKAVFRYTVHCTLYQS